MLLLALDSVPAVALSYFSDSLSDGSDAASWAAAIEAAIEGNTLADALSHGAPQELEWYQPKSIAQIAETRADSGQVQTNLLEPVQVEPADDTLPPVAPSPSQTSQNPAALPSPPLETTPVPRTPAPVGEPVDDLPGSEIESLPSAGAAADLQGELLTPQPFFGQLDPDQIFAPIQLDSVAPFPGVPFLTQEEPNFVFAPFRTDFSPLERPQYRLFNFETASTLRQQELVLRAGTTIGSGGSNCDDDDVSCEMRIGVDYGIRDDLLFTFDLALQEGATIAGVTGGNSEARFSFNSISTQIKWQAFSDELVSFAPTLGLLVGPQRSIVFSPANTDSRIEANDTSVVAGLALPVSITLGEVNRFTISPQVSFFPGSLSDIDVTGDPNDLDGRNGFNGDSLDYYGTVVGIGLGFDRSLSQYFKFAANYTFIVAGSNSLDNGDDSLFVPRGVWDAGFRWTPNSRTGLDLYLTNRFSNTASPASLLAAADGDISIALDFSFLPDVGNDYPIEIRNRYPATYRFLSASTGFPAATLPMGSILYETVFGSPGRVAGTVRYGLLDDLELVALGSSNGTDQFRSEAGLLLRYALLRDLGDNDISASFTFGVQNLFGDPDVALYTDVPAAFALFDDRLLLTVAPKGAVPIQGNAFDAIGGISTGINLSVIDRTQLWGQWTPTFGDNWLDDGSSDEFADLDGNRQLFTVGVRQIFPSGNSTYALDFFYSNSAGEYGVQGLTALPDGDTRLGARFSILNGVPWQTREAEAEAAEAATVAAAPESDTELESDTAEVGESTASNEEDVAAASSDDAESTPTQDVEPEPEPDSELEPDPEPELDPEPEAAFDSVEEDEDALDPLSSEEVEVDDVETSEFDEPSELGESSEPDEPSELDTNEAIAEEPEAEADELAEDGRTEESDVEEVETEEDDESAVIEPIAPLIDPLAVDAEEDSEPPVESGPDLEPLPEPEPEPPEATAPQVQEREASLAELSPEQAESDADDSTAEELPAAGSDPVEDSDNELPEPEADSELTGLEVAENEPVEEDTIADESAEDEVTAEEMPEEEVAVEETPAEEIPVEEDAPDVVGAAPSVPEPPANANPILLDDTGSTQEDTPLSFGPTDLLANDSDPDGDTLTIASVQDATNGEVVLNDDGTIAFTPTADVSGQGSFSYTVADGNGGFDTAIVDIELAPVNDPPLGDDDTGLTAEDTPLTLAAADLLANDSDLDGDPLTIVSVQDPTNGNATLNNDGSVAFTPNADFNGLGSFSYTVDDGNGSTAIARVTVEVTPTNDAPIGAPDSGTIDQGTSLTLSTADLLANDSDIDGDALAVASVQEASNGSVILNADNTVTFTPRPDFSGQATFTYTLSDGSDGTDTATVTVTVTAVAPAPPPEQPPAPDTPDELAPDADPEAAPGYVPPSTSADDLLAPIPEAPNSAPPNNGEGN